MNSVYPQRLATLNAHYLKALREDPSLIHLGDEGPLSIRASAEADLVIDQPITLQVDLSGAILVGNLDAILWERLSGPGEANFSDASALEPSVTFTFTDQDGVADTLHAQVEAADYPGNYFGFLPVRLDTAGQLRPIRPDSNGPGLERIRSHHLLGIQGRCRLGRARRGLGLHGSRPLDGTAPPNTSPTAPNQPPRAKRGTN